MGRMGEFNEPFLQNAVQRRWGQIEREELQGRLDGIMIPLTCSQEIIQSSSRVNNPVPQRHSGEHVRED